MSEDAPETFRITTPEQLKAISDPFRQQIVGALAEPSTAKQAAETLGTPVGRLYHHIDQLVAAGLIRVVAERRRRGAIERTFQAVARRFAAPADAFGGHLEPAEARASYAQAALHEMLAGYRTDGGQELHVAKARVRLTAAALAAMEAELGAFLNRFAGPDGAETDILLFAAPRDADD